MKQKKGIHDYRRTGRKHVLVLPPQPSQDALMKKARHLPMFGPGITITVPLGLWPSYQELYGLHPVGWKNDKLYVRRIPRESKAGEEQLVEDLFHWLK